MTLPNLINAVLQKTAPMSATDLNDLNNKSQLWYEENMKEAQDKKKAGDSLSLKDKIFLQLDSWYVRVLLAVGFFWIVKVIQDLMRPGDDTVEHEDDDRR